MKRPATTAAEPRHIPAHDALAQARAYVAETERRAYADWIEAGKVHGPGSTEEVGTYRYWRGTADALDTLDAACDAAGTR